MFNLESILNVDNIYRLSLILIAVIIYFCLLKSYENDIKRKNEIIIPAMKELHFVKNFNPTFYAYEFLLSAFTNDYTDKLFLPFNEKSFYHARGRNWFEIEIDNISFEYNSLEVYYEKEYKGMPHKVELFDGFLIKIKKEYINIDSLPIYDGLLDEFRDVDFTVDSNKATSVYKMPENTYKIIEDEEYYWLFNESLRDLLSESYNESLIKTKLQAKEQATKRFNEFYNDFKKYLNIK